MPIDNENNIKQLLYFNNVGTVICGNITSVGVRHTGIQIKSQYSNDVNVVLENPTRGISYIPHRQKCLFYIVI